MKNNTKKKPMHAHPWMFKPQVHVALQRMPMITQTEIRRMQDLANAVLKTLKNKNATIGEANQTLQMLLYDMPSVELITKDK